MSVTVKQVWGMPQVNRPNQMIEATPYPLGWTGSNEATYGQFVTYDKILAAGTQDRVQWVKQTGQNQICMRAGPHSTAAGIDIQNNGVRAGCKATWQDQLPTYKKALLAYQGDRTRDTFQVYFPSAGFPLATAHGSSGKDYFVLWFQWHQDDSISSGSPPIQFIIKQHPTTGAWWLFFILQAGGYTVGSTSALVPWMELAVFDTWYTVECEVYHSTVDAGVTDPRRGGSGHIKVTVNGSVKVDVDTWTIVPGSVYNFVDATIYHGRLIDQNLYAYFCDWEHRVVPGPAIADVVGQPSIITSPLRPYYTPP